MNRISLVISALLTINASNAAIAQADDTVDIYNAPVPIERITPKYPVDMARRGQEGWVMINYMVDTQGAVFEPTVVSSSAGKKFEDAALDAVKAFKFQPATYNDKAVESSDYIRITFSLDQKEKGASHSFASQYKRLFESLKNKNKTEADIVFEKMQTEGTLNNYEYAYLNYASAFYAAEYGNKYQQMEYLNEALLFESTLDENIEYLPKELVMSARRQLFILQIENKYYWEAISTWNILNKKDTEEFIKEFTPTYEQLITLQNDERSYSISASTDDNGFLSITLFKSGFSVDNMGSNLNEFKLRCQKKYVFFAFSQDKHYEIPKSWGTCNLQILGDANSQFKLVQD